MLDSRKLYKRVHLFPFLCGLKSFLSLQPCLSLRVVFRGFSCDSFSQLLRFSLRSYSLSHALAWMSLEYLSLGPAVGYWSPTPWFCSVLFAYRAVDQTQGFLHVRQVLYHYLHFDFYEIKYYTLNHYRNTPAEMESCFWNIHT